MENGKLVKLPCQQCGKKLGVRPDQLGRFIRCPACQHSFLAALPSDEVVPVSPLEDESEGSPDEGRKCRSCGERMGFMEGLVSKVCGRCKYVEAERKKDEE